MQFIPFFSQLFSLLSNFASLNSLNLIFLPPSVVMLNYPNPNNHKRKKEENRRKETVFFFSKKSPQTKHE